MVYLTKSLFLARKSSQRHIFNTSTNLTRLSLSTSCLVFSIILRMMENLKTFNANRVFVYIFLNFMTLMLLFVFFFKSL